jgi:DNA repair exonuclease SbcCD nuclease subunit
MLLTADWHLTDKAVDEYRWQIIDTIAKERQFGEPLYILGDLTDRKDRHSATLANRLHDALERLATDGPVRIIMGNHDAPMKGDPYWKLLNRLGGVDFYFEPQMIGAELLLLPWSPNPTRDWAEAIWPPKGGAIFMHQTVNGALLDDTGRKAIVPDGPLFPRGVKVYSGDIHTPQQIGAVTYVGAPHHVKFGDHYKLRMLRLNARYEIDEEIELRPPEKLLMESRSLDDWKAAACFLRPGAQIKVRLNIMVAQLNEWPAWQREIHELCAEAGIRVDSIEAVMVESADDGDGWQFKPILDAATAGPMEVLSGYCNEKRIDEAHRRVGQAILEELIRG